MSTTLKKITDKKKTLKRLLLCLLLFVVLFPNTADAKKTTPKKITKTKVETTDPKVKITAKSAIVMDLSTGAILYGKNIHKKMYPASITKIMTALVALEHSSLSEVITFSHDSVFNVDADSSRLWVAEGEKFTMESSLYALMLASANDVAYGISEKVGGTYSNFITMMNQKAAELGCKNTNFTNPHGLFDKKHYTTAYDMALISQEAFKSNIFRTIVDTRDYTIPKSNKEGSRYIYQHHKMIYNNSYHYEWFAGGKTGYTTDSGNTLVTFGKKGDRTLVCVLFRPADKYVQYKEAKTLLDYGFDNYSQVSPSLVNNDVSSFSFPTSFNSISLLMLKEPQASFQICLPKKASLSDVKQTITKLSLPSTSDQIKIARAEYTYKNLIVGTHDIFYIPLPDSMKKNIEIPKNNYNEPENSRIKKFQPQTLFIPLLLFILFLFLCFCFYLFYLLPKRRKKHTYTYRRRHKRRK